MVPQKSETKALILLPFSLPFFPPDRESGSEKVAVKHPHIPVFVSRLAHVPNSGILIRDSQKDAKTRPRLDCERTSSQSHYPENTDKICGNTEDFFWVDCIIKLIMWHEKPIKGTALIMV